MGFLEIVRRAKGYLEEHGRVSLRALKLEFELDEAQVEALVAELADIQQVAAREPGALAWAGRGPPGRARAAPAAQPERQLLDYTPRHLAEKILGSRSALEGERKQVTVLFADVKGSTRLAERAGPERWHEILDGYLRILAAAVHRFEGTVNQYTGDGIMALFGAPIAHEDHAQRACYAALWLRDELDSYVQRVRREQGLDLQTRIGLNSGEVVVGKIGDDLRMDYTAQGQIVHLAMRMEQLAEEGRPCLAPATAALVEGFFLLDELGDFRVEGVVEPLRVHVLAGIGEAHTRLDVARLRGLSRFVGRVHELESLEAALAQARMGHGQIVGVVGEAGVGKSRLCSEFLDQARTSGTAVYEAHCRSHGKTLSLLPMRELVRNLLGISEEEDEREQREKIAAAPVFGDASLEETLPLVLDFLGVAHPEQAAPQMAAEARQRQLFHFVRRLVQASSDPEAAVLFIDDVHWIDGGSDALLAQIVEAVSATRVLLLMNFRPDYHADWMGKSEYQQLPLRQLAAEEIEALLDERLGADASVSALREVIRERTAGNPFFIEEVVQALAESGSLEGERGAYRLVEPIETLEVPATVQPVLAARVDRLGEREKEVLQAASVIGREFSEPILSAVLGWADADLAEALQVLKDGELVHERSLYPVTEYAFKHPLTQEVALGSQLRERRARTHARAARALEAASPERLDEQAALIAHHWEEADEPLAAARWHQRAAEWLIRSNQIVSNLHWTRVYELAKPQPHTPETLGLLLSACVALVANAFYVGRPEDERERLAAEGRVLAERLENRRSSLWMLETSLAVSRNLSGSWSEPPLVPARRAVEIAEDLGSLEMRAVARFNLGNVLWLSGRVQEGLRETEAALELAGDDMELGVELQGFSLANFAWFQEGSLLMWLGRPGEAAMCFERCLEVAHERNEHTPICQASCWFGPAFEELTGTSKRALMRGHLAIERAKRSGSVFNETLAWMYLGWAQLMQGGIAKALESLLRVDHLQRHRRIAGVQWNLGQGLLAEAHLAAGDARSARTVANRCTADRDSWVFELRAHLSRSRVLRALDGPGAREEIEASLARAELLLDWSGARAFAPFIVEERARLAAVLGDGEGARALLCQARDLFGEVDATGHVERLTRELGS